VNKYLGKLINVNVIFENLHVSLKISAPSVYIERGVNEKRLPSHLPEITLPELAP